MNPEKLDRLRSRMHRDAIDAVWLQHRSNVAWLTDGARPYIHTAADSGVVSLIVTRDDCVALTSEVEKQRLIEEENMAHWRFITLPWHAPAATPLRLGFEGRIATDLYTADTIFWHADILACRTPLTAAECTRYIALGSDVSTALYQAACTLQPAMSELTVAGILSAALWRMGALPVVSLVAADARIFTVRHPLPTQRPAQHSLLLVVCAERHGLVVSLTRFVCFSAPPQALVEAVWAAARIDAAALHATRPGVKLREIWHTLMQAYVNNGYPEAWHGLHQGGACSYAPRDYFVTPDSPQHIEPPQAFAWNPSVPGGKSEDTVLLQADGLHIMTAGPWPTQSIGMPDGTVIRRPAILRLA